MNDALHAVTALRMTTGASATLDDRVIVEAPVALLYNGESFAVMMATPDALEDFALGFALGEGIVATPEEFRLVDIVQHELGVALHGAIPQLRFDALQERRRGMEGRSGCGLCGVESLQSALREVPKVASTGMVPIARIHAALADLSRRQPLNALSGGVHAAAFAHTHGLLVREDVGRHNALDKLIGAMARHDAPLPASDGFALITSRASYEMVHKAATAGLGLLVAISAPTDLAIRTAESADLTLAAFARGGSLNVYSHPQRIDAGS
ncbi:formate dehydrogenase accessory sulfurtransferase FdhD [Lysobacter sp.]|uniref:formate dehydrogenase accessory sulfurtransferase FdhD n=1 Tax=Lysobacter sp. TaxID=72226 RepID=UPI002D748643|nr:formate dehydrogenase accessory sulfurtransferase FdhD [Lysobacter sp.]HZX76676.1 formate dehydrogenase accessory sulfurtransferase FdhD [Lysobacter sp.]